MRSLRLLVILVIVLLAQVSFAWSPKEYATLTRLAAIDLLKDPATPPAMRFWLEEAVGAHWDEARLEQAYLNDRVGPLGAGLSGLAHWSVVPDLVAASDQGRLEIVEPFGVPERALHYLDLETFNASPAHRSFAPDLSGKPTFREIPREMHDLRYADSGMLPFRAQQCYDRLVDAIVARRLVDKPGRTPRDEHATRWAGYLAHYLADSWQPQHATVDYRLAWYFRDQRSLPDVQAEFEGRICDDAASDFPALRKEYWEAFLSARKQLAADGMPFKSRDVWEMSVQGLLYSYDALPLIGQAAARAYDSQAQTIRTDRFYHFRAAVGPKEMTVMEAKAELQAMAARQIAYAWLSAWEEASRRDPAAADFTANPPATLPAP